MQNLFHGGTDSIALTFTPQVLSQAEALPALFGPDSEASLESSVLGSILPGLDPFPPKPHAFPTSCSPTSPAPRLGGGSSTSPRRPVGDDERHGSTGRGIEANWIAGEPTGTGTAPAPGSMLRTITQGFNGRRRVRHGLRVLLRGAPRCGKTTILFDYCHRAAMTGCRVVLVLFKLGEEDPKYLPRSMRSGMISGDELRGWEAPALARIGIKYVRSRDDLAWYLASLHNLPRDEWPTVIAVDDLDKIVDTSVSGFAGGVAGTNPGGRASAATGAALRILALLQDTAEFFDNARADALENSATAATTAARTSPEPGDKRNPYTDLSSPRVPDVSGSNRDTRGLIQATVGKGEPGTRRDDNDSTRGISLEGMRTFVQDPQGRCGGGIVGYSDVEPVRVVGTCATSDQDLLWVYGRFMHAMARIQNTTGPDCFVLRVDTGASAAQHPPAPCAVPTLHGGGSDVERSVAFVRSRLDGSFSLF